MNTILAAIDFSDVTDDVIRTAREVTTAFGASLYLLHVEPPEPAFVGYEPGPEHVRNSVAHEAIRHFKEEHTLRDELRAAGVDAHSRVVQGPTVEKILSQARDIEAGLIVIGSHGHGAMYHLLMGSVVEGVLKRTRCPVLVVPAER